LRPANLGAETTGQGNRTSGDEAIEYLSFHHQPGLNRKPSPIWQPRSAWGQAGRLQSELIRQRRSSPIGDAWLDVGKPGAKPNGGIDIDTCGGSLAKAAAAQGYDFISPAFRSVTPA
jgi:hypothetical protein